MEALEMKRSWTPVLLILVAFLALLGGRFWASGSSPRLDVRTFTLHHRSGYEAAQLVQPYVFSDRDGAPGSMSATPEAISVRETPDNLDRIAQLLQDFDQPIPTLRLRFQLIEADSFHDPDPAIADVVQELRGLFRFEGYRLLGEALVSVAGGTMEDQDFTQRFMGTDEEFQVYSDVRPQRLGTVRLAPVQLREGGRDVLLETSVSVSSGQTVVIGGARARVGGRSFILTVTAEGE
jgi:hypothetical protein